MSRLLKALSLTVALATLNLITTSCTTTSTSGGTQIRMINAIPDSPPVDIFVSGSKLFTNLSFAAAQPNTNPASYVAASSGNAAFQGFATGTTTNPISPTGTVTLGNSTQYTVIAVGLELNDSAPIVIPDNNSVPTSGNVEFRVINVSPSSPVGGVDVYIVPPGTDITNYTPQISALGYGQASPYESLAFDPNGYSVIVTAYLSKIKLITLPSTAQSESITTLVILDNPGGNNGMSSTPLVLNDLN
jgi:hypothetical protein